MDGAAKAGKFQRIQLVAGAALLVLWAVFWTVSAAKNRMINGGSTYVPCFYALGCDFDISYYASREWFAGGDVYEHYNKGGSDLRYDHPPLVLVAFWWSNHLTHRAALIAWLCAQSIIISVAAWFCWRNRYSLNLAPVPSTCALAAILFSYPALYEMERGNWNSLVLLLVISTVWALQKRTLRRDILAGVLVGAAAWIKMYPGLLLVALLALRRWRAAGVCAAAMLSIGLVDLTDALRFKDSIQASARVASCDPLGMFPDTSHSVSGCWKMFCKDMHMKFLRKISGALGWGLLVFPVVLWVSYRVSRIPKPSQLLLPYFLWVVTAATYLPVIANDYNLIFLPLAALAVWDRRDNWKIHFLMATMLFWWQPFRTPVTDKFLWYSKLIGLGVVAAIIGARAKELSLVANSQEGSARRESVSLAAHVLGRLSFLGRMRLR